MVLDVDTRTEMRRLGIDHWVTAVAASPNGEIIAIGDSGGGVTLWNVADGTSTAVTIPGGNKPFWMPLVVTLAILLPCLAYWLRVRRNRSYVTGSDNDAAHPSQGERG
jgi:WD40 repeat protein